MSEMIKRVAAAMREVADIESPFLYEDMARAAIKAMREPTEAMISVGSGFIYEGYGHGPSIARDAWQDVVDEALREPVS